MSTVPAWRLRNMQPTRQGLVAWDRFGTTGLPVVLVHGTPWSSFVWRQVAAALSSSYAVYLFDLPGFGDSEKRDGQDVSIRAHAEVFEDLLAGWNLANPAVVAHDVGGAIALRAALLHAQPVCALALLDPVALSPWGSPFYRLVRDHHEVFNALPPHIHTAVADAYIRSALHTPLAPDVLAALLRPWLDGEGQAAFYRQIAHGDEQDTDEFRPQLANLDCPTLILWGRHDSWLPPEQGQELARLIPHAALHTIADAGHLLQEDALGEVLRYLLPFLAAIERT
jgi:pimeloyl-ACP methyl ester carboxylesterase